MKKADNIFVRAKKYVSQHPRTTFQEAIQIVAGKKVSGTRKTPDHPKRKPAKRVTGTKAPAKKTTPARKPTVTVKVGKIGAIQTAKKIISKIDKLERERTAAKGKELKDIYALSINAEHQKLKNMARAMKQKAS